MITSEIGSFVRIEFKHGEVSGDIEPSFFQPLCEAVNLYVNTGVDSLVDIVTCIGARAAIVASQIGVVHESSPECRERFWERDAQFTAEENEMKERHKVWSPDDE